MWDSLDYFRVQLRVCGWGNIEFIRVPRCQETPKMGQNSLAVFNASLVWCFCYAYLGKLICFEALLVKKINLDLGVLKINKYGWKLSSAFITYGGGGGGGHCIEL